MGGTRGAVGCRGDGDGVAMVSWPPLGVMAAFGCHGCPWVSWPPRPAPRGGHLVCGQSPKVGGAMWRGRGHWWVRLLGGGGACGRGHAHIITMATSGLGDVPRVSLSPFVSPGCLQGVPRKPWPLPSYLGCPQGVTVIFFVPRVSPGCQRPLLHPQGVPRVSPGNHGPLLYP